MEQIIYRMSELGGCVKAIAAAKLGYQPLSTPEDVQVLFNEGHRLEDIAIERISTELGIECYDQQAELNLPISSTILLQGHIDAKGKCNEWRYNKTVEIKTMRPKSFNNFVAMGWDTPGLVQKYKWQTSGYMLGTTLELALIAIDSDPDIEDDYERRIHIIYQEVPFFTLAEIRTRILTAHQWVQQGELPPGCNVKQYPCPFLYLHDDEVEILEDGQIDTLARAYKAAQRDNKASREREEKIKAALVEQSGRKGRKSSEVKDLNGEKVEFEKEKLKTVGGTSISRWEQRNPWKLSEELAKKDGVDLEKYKVQSKSWRIRVDVKEDGSERKDMSEK